MLERSICPYCSAPAKDGLEEVEHMNATHPEVIVERLRNAGFHQDPQTGEWIDMLASDD